MAQTKKVTDMYSVTEETFLSMYISNRSVECFTYCEDDFIFELTEYNTKLKKLETIFIVSPRTLKLYDDFISDFVKTRPLLLELL